METSPSAVCADSRLLLCNGVTQSLSKDVPSIIHASTCDMDVMCDSRSVRGMGGAPSSTSSLCVLHPSTGDTAMHFR